MRVLHVIDTLGVGGAETWLLALARHWRDRGEAAPRLDIVATSGRRGVFDDEMSRLGVRVFYLPFGRAALPSFVRGWREILRRGQYDALHGHQDYSTGWHFLFGFGALPRVRVVHVHSAWFHIGTNYATDGTRKVIAFAGKRLVERFATHICGTSAEVLRQYGFVQGVGPSVRVLHCGIAVDRFAGPREADRLSVREEFQWENDARIILFIGRLDQAIEVRHPKNNKNSWLAVEVAIEALKRDARVRLVMVGAGDAPRQTIEQRLREKGLAEKFVLTGVRHDVPRLMRAADVLLFPSIQEGLGMAAVEAQAAGLPVVMSNGVPAAAAVVPGLCTTLSLQQPCEAWADALLLAMQRSRPSPTACAQALCDSAFSIERSAKALEEIYRGAA